MTNTKPAVTPAAVTVAVAANPAKYAETARFTVVKDAGKRGASAQRFAAYGGVGATFTLAAYLDACLALQPEEPRHRWRADITWDLKRGFIAVAEDAPKAE